MKLQLNIILIFCSLMFSINGSSQEDYVNNVGQARLIGEEGRKFMYENQSYEYEELAPVFEAHPEALKYYDKTIVKAKWAKRTTNMLVGFGVFTGVTYYLASKSEFGNSQFFTFFLSSALFSVITVAMIPISITQSALKVKYRKKSILMFNEIEILENGYIKDASFLKLGLN